MLISRPPYDHVEFDDSDLLRGAFYATSDPHALWAQLRETEPAYYCKPGGGREPFWLITRYHDVVRILSDYRRFTSRRGTMMCIVELGIPDIASDDMMPDADPPRHTQFRRPLMQALTSRAVAGQAPTIREIARSMLLEPALDGGSFDFAKAALMFPMAFTGRLMGLQEEVWPRMSELTTMTIAYDDPEFTVGSPATTIRQAHHELFDFFRDEVSRRVPSDPGADLIGILMSMEVDGQRLTEQQVILNCYALLLGANVTTPHAASTMVSLMAEHPSQFQMVRDDPALRPRCVQEVLRWSSPATNFMRYAVGEVQLHGSTIQPGEPVTVWLGSANRDERAFRDPYAFDVTRSPNRHVAFGIGPHHCIGFQLANLGLQVLLDELVNRVESVELAGDVEHLVSNFVAGYRSMPVRLTPRMRRMVSHTTGSDR